VLAAGQFGNVEPMSISRFGIDVAETRVTSVATFAALGKTIRHLFDAGLQAATGLGPAIAGCFGCVIDVTCHRLAGCFCRRCRFLLFLGSRFGRSFLGCRALFLGRFLCSFLIDFVGRRRRLWR
jgi:hypothetical protein